MRQPEHKGDWMETHTGLRFYPIDPTPDQFDPLDVAHALSQSCRYGGHTKRFYSVAEHACILADYAQRQGFSPQDQWTILHHDDAEAYICDLPRPVKHQMPAYKEAEALVESVLFDVFHVEYPFPVFLKGMDNMIIADERAQVMNRSKNVWYNPYRVPLGVKLWNVLGRWPAYVKWQWLRRHNRLAKLLGHDHLVRKWWGCDWCQFH